MHRSHLKLILTLLALITLLAGTSVAQVPRSKHVYVVAEENHSYEHMVGSPYMPYFNSLIAKGGLATQFYADMHGSLENYLILASGQYLTRNNETTTVFTVDNIERHLLNHGMTFKSYAESLPSAGFTGLYSGYYVKRHAPLPYFGEMAHSSLIKDHLSTNVLATDIANSNLPNFGFITPNLLHDIHNCPNGLNTCLQTADNWLKTHIAPLLARPEFRAGGDGLLIVWADEADLSTDNRCSATVSTGCGGHIPVILIGPRVKAGYKSTKTYHHSSVLRTILEMMGTTTGFPAKANTAPDMREFFKTSSSAPLASTVKITAPTTSTVVGTSVHLAATASGPHPITAMRIYVDNVSKYFVHAASVSTQLTLSKGSHHVVFQAWDSTGAVFKASKTITVQ